MQRSTWLVSLLLAAATLAIPRAGDACTTILIGAELTRERAIIHAHNEEMGAKAVGRLWHRKRAHADPGTKLSVPYVELAAAPTSLAYWASGNAEQASGLGTSEVTRPYDSILVGLNQAGVAMGCNWAHSREENLKERGVRRYAIRQLILERAATARQGVQLIGDLIDEHGQADWGGLVYLLADPNEAWVIETTTHHWAARKIHDDEIWVTANRFRIGDDYDLASTDLVSYATDKGWYTPGDVPFRFDRAYGRPGKMNDPYDIMREQRVLELLRPKRGQIVAADIMQVFRDRYEGTPMFTPPQAVEIWRKAVNADPKLHRPINTNITQSSSITLLRKDMPVELGAVMHYAMATPSYSGYFPVYAGVSTLPDAYSQISAAKDPGSAWWVFRNLQQAGDKRYTEAQPKIRALWQARHRAQERERAKIEKRALALWKRGSQQEALALSARFTLTQAAETLELARELLKQYRPPKGQ
ncbi:MAG: C69 family dipeptidase [Deltaproteobacteria bacterium]|nr:C69 family dipeptidase [Deltaproteobacteria bacterium]